MAFGDHATLLSNFSGPDENPLSEGGNWNHVGLPSGAPTLEKVSGQVTNSRSSGVFFERDYFWTPAKFGPACEAHVTAAAVGTDSSGQNQIDIALRLDNFDPDSPGSDPGIVGYLLVTNGVGQPNGWDIVKFVSGVATSLASATQVRHNGDQIGFRVQLNHLDAWINTGSGWTLVVEVTDTDADDLLFDSAAGYFSFGCASSAIKIADAWAGTIPSLGMWLPGRGKSANVFRSPLIRTS